MSRVALMMASATTALCYETGSDLSLTDSYYWFQKYLSSHNPSCSGCERESTAIANLEKIKKNLYYECSNCKKEKHDGKPLDVCPRCHLASYCNRECQREHWVSHKEICKQIWTQQQGVIRPRSSLE